jgi:hypothetical protein
MIKKKTRTSQTVREIESMNSAILYLNEKIQDIEDRVDGEQKRRCMLVRVLLAVLPKRWLRKIINLDGDIMTVRHALEFKIDP